MKLKALIFLVLPFLAIARPLLSYTTIPHRPIIHDGKTLLADMKSAVIHARDSITINISNSFSHANVSNSHNNAKFEVVNNAKNAAIALGDNFAHDVKLDSFGDKNMLNSTGSNTGGWSTKNRGSNISTDGHKKSPVYEYLFDWYDSKDKSSWKPGGIHKEYQDGVGVEVPNMQHTDPNVVPEWYTKSKMERGILSI